MRRLDGSLAELTTYAPALTHPDVSGTEFGLFAQDRWRLNDRVMFELGLRVDRDDIVGTSQLLAARRRVDQRAAGGPRDPARRRRQVRSAHAARRRRVHAVSTQTVTRFDPPASRWPARHLRARVVDPLKTPESLVQTLAWDQRFGRKIFFKAAYLHRNGSHEAIVDPDPRARRADAVVDGRVEVLGVRGDGALPGERIPRPHRVVRAVAQHARPERLRSVLRQLPEPDHPAERELAQPDRRAQPHHRPRHHGSAGQVGLHRRSSSGARVSRGPAVDEFQDFVGERNRAGRLPSVSTLDFSLVRPWKFRKYRFIAG